MLRDPPPYSNMADQPFVTHCKQISLCPSKEGSVGETNHSVFKEPEVMLSNPLFLFVCFLVTSLGVFTAGRCSPIQLSSSTAQDLRLDPDALDSSTA